MAFCHVGTGRYVERTGHGNPRAEPGTAAGWDAGSTWGGLLPWRNTCSRPCGGGEWGATTEDRALSTEFFLFADHRPERALRLRRLMMAIYSYALMWLGTWLGAELSILDPRTPHLLIFGTLCALNGLFFIAIRTGFSERFHDPSLTMVQMLAGIVVITLLLHHARELRGAMLSLYLMMMTFGVFSLNRRQQVLMAATAQVAFTGLLIYEWLRTPLQQILTLSLSQWSILLLILCWFVFMGGYIHNLQQQFRAQRVSLRQAHDRLARIAVRDELTGLFNRRHFLERLDEELMRHDRGGPPVHLALIDLDHFKRINDNYGHRAGDQVLQRFATVAGQCLRRSDVLARYGGEEFVILFPQADYADCEAAITRLRERFAAEPYRFDTGLRVTLSCGLAGHQRQESAATFIDRADKALYQAKAGGRNTLRRATPAPDHFG